jgi:hypothetical protein
MPQSSVHQAAAAIAASAERGIGQCRDMREKGQQTIWIYLSYFNGHHPELV